MALPIRKGATHKVVIGPAVAVGDGFTPITTLDEGTADEAEAILHDNGTVVDISAYTLAAIATADGYYHLTLQTGITNTEGHLTILYNDDSLMLPLKAEFIVMSTVAYDALYAATSTMITTLDLSLLHESTIGTVNTQVSYDMDTAIVTDDNWIGLVAQLEDVSTGDTWVTWVADVDQANDRIIVADAPTWTVVAGDKVRVIGQQHPTYALNTYDPPTRAELTSDISGLNDITAAAVWAVECEDQGSGYTAQEIMSLLLAEAMGTAVYTSGTRTWVVKDPSGTETRLTVVYSAELDGDRSTSTPAPMTP